LCGILRDLRLQGREVSEFLFGTETTDPADADGIAGRRRRAAEDMRFEEGSDGAAFDGGSLAVVGDSRQGLALEDDFDGVDAEGGLEFGLPGDVHGRETDGAPQPPSADDHAFGFIWP